MLKKFAWLELFISLLLLVLAFWPMSEFCSGRPLGHDCESWFIFGVNIFGPIGASALVCSFWSLKINKLTPQYFLLFTCSIVLIFWELQRHYL
jgi:hypothetical protein